MNLRVFICGDSTASSYPPEAAPQAGWGQCFQTFFDDGVTVENRAIGARSTKSFIAEGRLLQIERDAAPGDYLFIQFGHNDQARIRWRQTDDMTSYRDNLLLFVHTARALRLQPVLLTSICQRVFDQNGAPGESLGLYPSVMRAIAAQYGVPLIDLYAESRALVERLGDEGSKSLYMHVKGGVYAGRPDDLRDNTHTQYRGARAYAALAARGVMDSDLPDLSNRVNAEKVREALECL